MRDLHNQLRTWPLDYVWARALNTHIKAAEARAAELAGRLFDRWIEVKS